MKKRNYHSHTWRCRHAVGTEREYIKRAIAAGYESFGFSDHMPWPGIVGSTSRMDMDQLDGYIQTVLALKEEYKNDIRVELGLECEYFPAKMAWLKEIKEKYALKYLIFGNHFDGDELSGIYFGMCRDREDVRHYVSSALAGMETGLYAWLAHPDLYMRSLRVFDEDCRNAAVEICRAAKAHGLPLEYNLLGMRSIAEGRAAGLGYPCAAFWEIAAREGCGAIMNVDAHHPDHIANTSYYELGAANLKKLGMPIFDLDARGALVPSSL